MLPLALQAAAILALIMQICSCWNGRKISCCKGNVTGLPYPKNGNTDTALSLFVQLKYFNKFNVVLGKTWSNGGQTISFNGSQIILEDDSTFIPDIKTVFFVHGFMSDASQYCDDFVQNYGISGMDVQVICVDWRDLAFTLRSLKWWDQMLRWWDTYRIDSRNAIDVGWWMGRLIHCLVEQTGLHFNQTHLIGHSLGAHVVGEAGRTFTSLTSKKLARVTGLDPAGPIFVQDRDGLRQHRIGRDSGQFVDVIHTNGHFNPYVFNVNHIEDSDYMGDLHALGHADFYPNGGRKQGASGCLFTLGVCSHVRSVVFYLRSILDGPNAFPAFPCSSPSACSQGKLMNDTAVNHMGEFARKQDEDEEASNTYYLEVNQYGPLWRTILGKLVYHIFY